MFYHRIARDRIGDKTVVLGKKTKPRTIEEKEQPVSLSFNAPKFKPKYHLLYADQKIVGKIEFDRASYHKEPFPSTSGAITHSCQESPTSPLIHHDPNLSSIVPHRIEVDPHPPSARAPFSTYHPQHCPQFVQRRPRKPKIRKQCVSKHKIRTAQSPRSNNNGVDSKVMLELIHLIQAEGSQETRDKTIKKLANQFTNQQIQRAREQHDPIRMAPRRSFAMEPSYKFDGATTSNRPKEPNRGTVVYINKSKTQRDEQSPAELIEAALRHRAACGSAWRHRHDTKRAGHRNKKNLDRAPNVVHMTNPHQLTSHIRTSYWLTNDHADRPAARAAW